MNPQTLIKASLVAAVLATSSFGLTGCGFHLRGFEAPLHFDVAKTVINLEDNKTAFPLKLPLSKRLSALGAQVIDGMSVSSDNLPTEPLAAITVKNVKFRRYELVGVLTEIRLVLSADVTYQTLQNGEPVTLSNPIQVERSYQYNEASVSTEDQQGSQIRDWLYDSLARRISDQYVAIGLPNTPPKVAKSVATPVIKP